MMKNSTYERAMCSAQDRFESGLSSGRRRASRHGQRGSALVASLVVFVAVAGLVVASTQLSSIEIQASRRTVDDVRATALAEAGVERSKAIMIDAARKAAIQNPLDGVRALFAGSTTVENFAAEPMLADGVNVGEYSTTMTLNQDNARKLIVTITSTGYVPAAPANLGPGEKLQSWDSIDVTVEYEVAPSQVFDYAYFVNNWGWLYANTAYVNGSARSNGQMDFGGYSPTVTGGPTYSEVSYSGGAASLGDRTSDGGVYSSWDIVNAQNGQGMAADTDYHFDFEDPIEMPNLSDLSVYETRALSVGANISIGGVTVADAIVGDVAGESQNLFLEGTLANPIVLDGPVVVRGDVMISGYVTGQGTIYSGGNVYVPESVEYLNGPATSRPASNSDTDTAAWLTTNHGTDFLGLFARENVVIGDFTNRTWRRYVSGWLASPLNASVEDSGSDLIPNTANGPDGIAGTADDDLLERDGVFTTELYTAADAAAGLIPSGFSVGDTIPGTGEDIDGDGQFDATLTLADFDFSDPLVPSHWEGNMPASGIAKYSSIASLYANRLDASFYTNHALSWVVLGSDPATVNGAMVARNESIVYGTPSLNFNHDARLLGGTTGIAGELLPHVLQPIKVLQWRRSEVDPFLAIP